MAETCLEPPQTPTPRRQIPSPQRANAIRIGDARHLELDFRLVDDNGFARTPTSDESEILFNLFPQTVGVGVCGPFLYIFRLMISTFHGELVGQGIPILVSSSLSIPEVRQLRIFIMPLSTSLIQNQLKFIKWHGPLVDGKLKSMQMLTKSLLPASASLLLATCHMVPELASTLLYG